MCEVAQGGRIVYHGRAGQELFPGIRHVLKVLIIASMDYRIQQAKTRRGLDNTNARQFLKELARDRGRRLRALFNIDWQAPIGNDLDMNTTHTTPATADDPIHQTTNRQEIPA